MKLLGSSKDLVRFFITLAMILFYSLVMSLAMRVFPFDVVVVTVFALILVKLDNLDEDLHEREALSSHRRHHCKFQPARESSGPGSGEVREQVGRNSDPVQQEGI